MACFLCPQEAAHESPPGTHGQARNQGQLKGSGVQLKPVQGAHRPWDWKLAESEGGGSKGLPLSEAVQGPGALVWAGTDAPSIGVQSREGREGEGGG